MRTLTDAEKRRVRELLAVLVGIDSSVPAPQDEDRLCPEARIASWLADHLRGMGMAVETREMVPGRANLVAHWPDQPVAGRRSLMLEAHMDTVTAEGMTVDPFGGEVRDGRMYGRGTCDTKGSMAAFLTAMAIARESDRLPADKLYFVATCAEETGCRGARALMAGGFRTDAAIVGEPTGCRLVTAHKQPLWIRLETLGRACHASTPGLGVNAVERMARAVSVVHGPWAGRLAAADHPLLGNSTAAVTCIEGGARINIIPASCRAEIDARIVPGLSCARAVEDLDALLAEEIGAESFRVLSAESFGALDAPPDAPLVRRLLDLCRQANGQSGPEGVNYFADTGPFHQAGILAVLFGPGDIAQAHTADEFISLDQLEQATAIMVALLTGSPGKSLLQPGENVASGG